MKKSGRRAAIFIRPIYDGWLAEPPRDTLLIVRYETLFTHKTMQLVADFVGRPPVAYRDLYGKGSKFSGLPTEAAGWYDEETEERFQITWETASVQSANGESSGARVLDRARGVGVRVRKPEAGQEPSEFGVEDS
jgi:hypothetical protein